MRRYANLAACAVALALTSSNALAADAERGRQLVAAHCGECHDSGVYGSAQRKAKNLATVRQQIQSGALALGLNWSDNEITDVEEYLNQTFYQY